MRSVLLHDGQSAEDEIGDDPGAAQGAELESKGREIRPEEDSRLIGCIIVAVRLDQQTLPDQRANHVPRTVASVSRQVPVNTALLSKMADRVVLPCHKGDKVDDLLVSLDGKAVHDGVCRQGHVVRSCKVTTSQSPEGDERISGCLSDRPPYDSADMALARSRRL